RALPAKLFGNASRCPGVFARNPLRDVTLWRLCGLPFAFRSVGRRAMLSSRLGSGENSCRSSVPRGGGRKVQIACVVLLAAVSVGHGQEAKDTVRVMSFNIRYHNPADGPNAWPHRKDWVAEIIREHADVAGLQEVRKDQLDDLK